MSFVLVNLTFNLDRDSELLIELFSFVLDVLFDRVFKFLSSDRCVLGITPHSTFHLVNGTLIQMHHTWDTID